MRIKSKLVKYKKKARYIVDENHIACRLSEIREDLGGNSFWKYNDFRGQHPKTFIFWKHLRKRKMHEIGTVTRSKLVVIKQDSHFTYEKFEKETVPARHFSQIFVDIKLNTIWEYPNDFETQHAKSYIFWRHLKNKQVSKSIARSYV